MTTGEVRGDDIQCVRDPLRQVVLTVLAIYLAPVVLVVLLLSGLGLACCAVARLFERKSSRKDDRLRRDGAARATSRPHVHSAVRSRLPG